MNKAPNVLFNSGLILLLAAILLSSCVPMKRIRYLQDPEKKEDARTDFKKPESVEYLVHKGDNLYIKVNSLDDKTNYLQKTGAYENYYTEPGIYLNSYTVNDSGYVEFPLIGKVGCIS